MLAISSIKPNRLWLFQQTKAQQYRNDPGRKMTISLVICTRNRAEQLARCLDNLSQQKCSEPWELVIVDNGSTDNTQKTIEQHQATAPFAIKSLVEATPGLGRARNKGWQAATGDIVAFTDDDCYPAPDFLEATHNQFAQDADLGFLGGRILLHDPTDYRITIQEKEDHENIAPRSFIPAGLIQGANFSFRRNALNSVGGFDDDFGAGALFPCEDVDILARLSSTGWKGAYSPLPVVFHHHGRKTQEEADRLMKQYDHGRGAYYAKCLFNPALRSIVFRRWLSFIRRQPKEKTGREVLAALEYVWHRARNVTR